ncbi:MAG TPA: hypothetical protein VFS67_18840 [Polyangiaceae bacterium]|nr:hypothetical protein [Polyangiaceae bacterium]
MQRQPRRSSQGARTLLRHSEGAVFVEFLICFLPVYVFFLCLVQLGVLFAVRLLVDHAAISAARAAAVVIGDDPGRYGGEPLHRIDPERGRRRESVRGAALLALAPLIANGTIQGLRVEFPPGEQPGVRSRSGPVAFSPLGPQAVSKVRVRVEVDAACRIGFANRIACPLLGGGLRSLIGAPTLSIGAEAFYPYQGARYVYP